MRIRNYLLLCALSAPVLYAQGPAQPHCTADKKADFYLCDREAFQARLARAHTVRINTGRMDLFGQKQMRDLVEGLGKQVVESGRADLVFNLSLIDRTGHIEVGPGDVAIATLNVYDPARGNGRQSLIWAETFEGNPDRPWPSVVIDLVNQFHRNAMKQ